MSSSALNSSRGIHRKFWQIWVNFGEVLLGVLFFVLVGVLVFFFPLLLFSCIEQLSEISAVSGTFLVGQASFKSSFGLQHLSRQPGIALAGEQETSDGVRNALCVRTRNAGWGFTRE